MYFYHIITLQLKKFCTKAENNLHIEKKSIITIGMKGWGLGTELNLLKTQVRKNSLNISQIVQSSPDPCHVITSVRTQPLSSFILQPERGYNCLLCQLLDYLKHIYKTRKRLQYQKTEQFKGLSKECKQSLTVDHMTDIGLQHEERLLQNFSKLKPKKHCPKRKFANKQTLL